VLLVTGDHHVAHPEIAQHRLARQTERHGGADQPRAEHRFRNLAAALTAKLRQPAGVEHQLEGRGRREETCVRGIEHTLGVVGDVTHHQALQHVVMAHVRPAEQQARVRRGPFVKCLQRGRRLAHRRRT